VKDQEIEVKFFVLNIDAIKKRLDESGALLIQPRILETNLRFDTPDHLLSQSFKVLRLRHDTKARLTYKGPAQSLEGARIRQELEFVVEDFRTARLLLEALGYQIVLIYEKFRSTYELNGVDISIDEMPYGNFVEIEGPTVEEIHSINEILRLKWDANIPSSYSMLFEQLKVKKHLLFRDLIFENFSRLVISADDLGVQPADKNDLSD
jgi:adenylate cyclase, class 2